MRAGLPRVSIRYAFAGVRYTHAGRLFRKHEDMSLRMFEHMLEANELTELTELTK